jgi:hypothetical protein
LLGKAAGDFQNQMDFPILMKASFLGWADFNKDTKLDIVLANLGNNSVSILLWNGDRSFGNQTSFPVGNRPVAIASGFFNDDKILDLAVSNY